MVRSLSSYQQHPVQIQVDMTSSVVEKRLMYLCCAFNILGVATDEGWVALVGHCI